MHLRRWWASGLVVVMMASWLLALGVDALAGSSQQPVNLRIYWWGNQERHDRTLKALEAYRAKNPHVSFTPEFTAWSGYWDKLAVMVASGNPPDIIQMDYAYLLEYAQRGALMDLAPWVGSALVLDDMDPQLAKAGMVDGKLYAISLGLNVQVLHVNRTLLSEAGLELPPLDWTWEDFFDYSRKVTGALGPQVWFSADFSGEINYFEHWVRQRGRPGIYQGNRLAIDEEDVASWWAMWKSLRDQGLAPPAEVSLASSDELYNYLIVKRQAVAHRGWSNEHERFAVVMQDEMVMTPLPRGGQAEGHYPKSSMFFSVSSRSRHAEEAARFINWFIQAPEALDILRSNRGTPVTSAGRALLQQMGLSQYDVKVFDIEDKILAFAGPVPPPAPKGGAEIRDLFERTSEEVQFGRRTPEDGARYFIAEATRILQRAASQ
ncbi:ABC transporter substrate-binding protein [Geochorda subterranea]|uniref:Extracellular solute-binding protein n=1 Tax=Geochorda subterranea TaxID=3109564 RepID=A0ABZ1BNM8_9FIRM|nr:extracellular solute-binding protein [Limnochorda sp. LNt]WRP14440.1 extracellular solute-binding protein [Limnochorda sp. LNt]